MRTGHLPLPTRDDYSVNWLATPGNHNAFEAVKRWCQGEPPLHTVIVGPCSKTFLALMASKKVGINPYRGVIPPLEGHSVVLDDADHITDSEALFHWYNEVVSGRIPVLLTSHTPPNAWPHQLPDLVSRLRTLPFVRIEPWTDDELGLLLPRMMRTQGLEMTEMNARFALQHMERSFEALRRLVDFAHHHAPRRRVTKTFLRAFFEQTEYNHTIAL